MWRFSTFGAIAAVAGLALVPAANGATSDERAQPVVTARVVLPTTALAAPRWGAKRLMLLEGATTWTGLGPAPDGHRPPHGHRRALAGCACSCRCGPNESAGWVRANRVRLSATRVRFEVHLGSRRLEIWRGTRRLHAWSAGVGRAGPRRPRSGASRSRTRCRRCPSWRSVYGAWTLTLTAHSNALRTFMGGDALVAIHGSRQRPVVAGGAGLELRLRDPRRSASSRWPRATRGPGRRW